MASRKTTYITFFPSAREFRSWLEQNHADSRELLVGLHRTESGKGGVTYPEALDEALCFGWIDGIRRRHDEIQLHHPLHAAKAG